MFAFIANRKEKENVSSMKRQDKPARGMLAILREITALVGAVDDRA